MMRLVGILCLAFLVGCGAPARKKPAAPVKTVTRVGTPKQVESSYVGGSYEVKDGSTFVAYKKLELAIEKYEGQLELMNKKPSNESKDAKLEDTISKFAMKSNAASKLSDQRRQGLLKEYLAGQTFTISAAQAQEFSKGTMTFFEVDSKYWVSQLDIMLGLDDEKK